MDKVDGKYLPEGDVPRWKSPRVEVITLGYSSTPFWSYAFSRCCARDRTPEFYEGKREPRLELCLAETRPWKHREMWKAGEKEIIDCRSLSPSPASGRVSQARARRRISPILQRISSNWDLQPHCSNALPTKLKVANQWLMHGPERTWLPLCSRKISGEKKSGHFVWVASSWWRWRLDFLFLLNPLGVASFGRYIGSAGWVDAL